MATSFYTFFGGISSNFLKKNQKKLKMHCRKIEKNLPAIGREVFKGGRCVSLAYEPPMMRRGRVPRMMEPAAQMARTVPVRVGTWRGLSSGRGFSQYMARMILK